MPLPLADRRLSQPRAVPQGVGSHGRGAADPRRVLLRDPLTVWRTCGLGPTWFISIAVLWVWIEKVLRRSIEPVLHALGWLGKSALLVIEALLGLDGHLWARIREAQQEELVAVTARLRGMGHGRADEIAKWIESDGDRIRRHQWLQQHFGWLLGGDWYSDRTRWDIRERSRYSHPRVFELLVNGLGLAAFGNGAERSGREFARRLVVIRPAPRIRMIHDHKSLDVTLVDSSATGLRVKLGDAVESNLKQGDEVEILGSRSRFRCKVTRFDASKKLVGLRTKTVREIALAPSTPPTR